MIRRKPERKKRVSKNFIEHEPRMKVKVCPPIRSKDECTKASEEIKSAFHMQFHSDG